MIKRRSCKTISIGGVKIGGRAPIAIQSMTKTATADVRVTVRQISSLQKAGCEIVRVAVKNHNDASALKKIRSRINIPLVADIHFNYRLGLEAIACGVDGLRLNPGNIYHRAEVKQIAQACKKRKIPIRVGVNSGSLRTNQQTNKPTNELVGFMVKSAQNYIKMLESFKFYDIIVSLKAAQVTATVEAYRKLAKLCRYPLHLGITAAGLPQAGAIKSAIGIGSLLLEGIGDTIRVSLAGNPEQEVEAGQQILQALGLRQFGPEIIVCPTCGRTQSDIVEIARQVNRKLSGIRKQPLKIAIMGCEVNGPGEAAQADIGVACGKHTAVLFKKGKIIKKIEEKRIVDILISEICSY